MSDEDIELTVNMTTTSTPPPNESMVVTTSPTCELSVGVADLLSNGGLSNARVLLLEQAPRGAVIEDWAMIAGQRQAIGLALLSHIAALEAHYRSLSEPMRRAANEGARVGAEIERERCAKIAEESAEYWRGADPRFEPWTPEQMTMRLTEAKFIAAAIRKGDAS